ncbi:MAG: hypothetical protein IJ347_09370 [Faecalibacterium sp.]|nr:hypothetical protein [Faecalibacterium sp.]
MFDSYSERMRTGQMAGLHSAHARSLIAPGDLPRRSRCAHRFTITDPHCLACSGAVEGCANYEEEPHE